MDRESRLSRISSRTDTEIFDDGKGEKRYVGWEGTQGSNRLTHPGPGGLGAHARPMHPPTHPHIHVYTHRHTIFYMNIEVGRNKYYLHKRYTEFLMLHQVRRGVVPPPFHPSRLTDPTHPIHPTHPL